MAKDKDIEQLTNHFRGRDQFTRKELLEYYIENGEDIKDNTLKWRVHDLKNNNVIHSVGRGLYTILSKSYYEPKPDNLIEKINKLYLSKYDSIDYSIWNSSWLYGFMLHQPFSSFYVFETEKEICKDVFYLFKDAGLNAFYQPNENIIDDYVLDSKKAIIIKPIISRSPVNKIKKIKLALLEKILVDIFCDRQIYPMFNLGEQVYIFEAIFEHYIINFSKLLNYAQRRRRKNEIIKFINDNFDYNLK